MERYINQARLIDTERLAASRFVVIGAGAIGSYFVTTLAKMGAQNITVYDYDTIETHNISNQIYPIKHIGIEKTRALQLVTREYAEVEITIKGKWSAADAVQGDIIVAAVDNMDVRKMIWDYYKNQSIELFIDGRMSAQVYRTYSIDPASEVEVREYEKTLYPQSEAVQERCGEKSIIYTVSQVSGQMLAMVKLFLMKEYRPWSVTYDCLNLDIAKRYSTTRVMDVVEA